MAPGVAHNQHPSYEHHPCGGERERAHGTDCMSLPGAKSLAGHVCRVEAIGKFAAGSACGDRRRRRVPWVSSSAANDAPPASATKAMRHIRLAWEYSARGGEKSWPQARPTISTHHTSIIHTVGSEQRTHGTDCMSLPGAKRREGHDFRVEAIGKFSAGQEAKSKKGLCCFVKRMLGQVLHAVAGAGGAYPGTY